MKKWLVMVATALCVAALAPAVPAGAADPGSKPPATKPAQVRHLTAEVVAVNTDAKTLTVRHGSKKEVTFTVAQDAAGPLKDLKPGQRVKVTYQRTGDALTAQAIVAVGHAAAK
jgi:Cu/Ag efflux protein CusF